MSDSDIPARKPRKSVAFADGQTIVDGNGDVTMESAMNGQHDGEKDSAVPHTRAGSNENAGAAVDEMTAMFEGLAKKKKSKKPKAGKEDGGDDDEVAGGEEKSGGIDDGEVDLSALKKKKKKKTPKATEDDFEAKLAEAGADTTAGGTESESHPAGADADTTGSGVQDGDLQTGTGVWAHNSTTPLSYASLLHRFFAQLHASHPDLAAAGSGKSYKIPPPQCLREGNKKTIFANLAEICRRMKRTDEHVTQFLFAELGTSGSVDGSRRLVIKGRFQQKQIENVLRRYIGEYFTAITRNPARPFFSLWREMR